ncbi:MAG: rhomboid family intramembrane serine protease [Planctomycetes bacterium]|nr:rhomboid family intramembrane serine protease [Planctomycetota bacterium]
MFLPLSTELAPERWPIGTLTLVLLNLVAAPLILTDLGRELVLVYGELAPWQWVTSAFLHGGPAHLGGNLLFLWAFGLIVEAFLGWQRFLAIYLAIAISQNAFEQTLAFVFDAEGGSLGASSAIYGLMAMAVLWAPLSEIRAILVFFAPWLRTYEIPVFWFGIGYIGLDLLLVVGGGFENGTPLLHVQGALFGGLAAWFLMHKKLIDTGGHDLLTLAMHGRAPSPARRRTERALKKVLPEASTSTKRSSVPEAALSLQSRAQEVLEEAYFGGAASAVARYVAILREAPNELRGLREAVLEKLSSDPAMQRAFEDALEARERTGEG